MNILEWLKRKESFVFDDKDLNVQEDTDRSTTVARSLQWRRMKDVTQMWFKILIPLIALNNTVEF